MIDYIEILFPCAFPSCTDFFSLLSIAPQNQSPSFWAVAEAAAMGKMQAYLPPQYLHLPFYCVWLSS